MSIQKRRAPTNESIVTGKERKSILLDPQPGEIWAALVEDEAVAYGKTLKEARERANQLRPDVEPVMFLIAFLWDLGFFQDSEEDGGNGAREYRV